MARTTAAGTCLAVLGLLLVHAQGHGLMVRPQSRNLQFYLKAKAYSFGDEANAGGAKGVSNGRTMRWPAGRHGVCGDPASGSLKYAKPIDGFAPTKYTANQVITVDSLIRANHYGRITVRICPKGFTSEAQCKQLQRSDGKGAWWYLPQIKSFSGGSWGADAEPLVWKTTSYSVRKFEEAKCLGPPNQWNGWCGHYTDNWVYSTTWRLPQDYVCPGGCVLQWYWMTGHSCWPPCDKADPTYPRCQPYTQSYPTCDKPGAPYPEEFWNCGDVVIVK